MSKKLPNKVAIVTGASKGIGASIAKHLAAEGASVVVNYSSSKEGADRVVAEITKAGGKAVAVKADVAKSADIDRLFAESKKAFGTLDILVNNAGIYEFLPLEFVTEDSFHKQFNLNVPPFRIRERLGDSAGHGPAPLGFQKIADPYLDKLAKELGPKKIRVNSINPGLVITEGVQNAGFEGGDFQKDFEAKAPLGRVGQPKDIAPAAVFLASDDSKFVTGVELNVDGGMALV